MSILKCTLCFPGKSALKQLSLAAYAPASQANRAQNFAQKAANFTECSQRLAGLGRMAAPQLVSFIPMG